MSGDFSERIDELEQRIGPGNLEGKVIVDQVYAKYQHERLDLHHPRGGGPKYLTEPLFDDRNDYLEKVARTVLDDGGKRGLADAMDDLAGKTGSGIATHAPVLFGDLRESGHSEVFEDGTQVYDNPARVHRLTEAELKAKGRLIPMPAALIGYIWWKVMKRTKPPGHYHGGYVDLEKAVNRRNG